MSLGLRLLVWKVKVVRSSDRVEGTELGRCFRSDQVSARTVPRNVGALVTLVPRGGLERVNCTHVLPASWERVSAAWS